jgi:cobyrinic acid a,c-diamide synthase
VTSPNPFPRLVIAGGSGDSGKTLLTLGLILAMRDRGLSVRAYKKGPDYIDAAWLDWASEHPARNLDTYLMGFESCLTSFLATGSRDGINFIEGNRGLFDGVDAKGTHGTTELAKHLKAPILLILNATKATRTVAAFVLGCQTLDPQAGIAGVVLNQVSSTRHEQVIREAIESECRLPVLGCLPRMRNDTLLPARHLGLVTPAEHPRSGELRSNLMQLIQGRVDLDRVLEMAGRAPVLPSITVPIPEILSSRRVRIGLLKDSALSFYYPENLEALTAAGAALEPVSSLTANALPSGLHALYIGGGFPETHGASLASNRDFLMSLRLAARSGMPIYAECGGLMLLSRAIHWQGSRYPMADVFPFEVEVSQTVQGHGYVEMIVDQPNPFFREGTVLRGHEFHYSRIRSLPGDTLSACLLSRGTGCGQGRDGLIQGNVWASYTHLHALGSPEWALGLVAAARAYSSRDGSP